MKQNDFIQDLREAAKDAEEAATTEEQRAYAQGAYDILGHLIANPTGKPVDLLRVHAIAGQLAGILEHRCLCLVDGVGTDATRAACPAHGDRGSR